MSKYLVFAFPLFLFGCPGTIGQVTAASDDASDDSPSWYPFGDSGYAPPVFVDSGTNQDDSSVADAKTGSEAGSLVEAGRRCDSGEDDDEDHK